MPYIGNIVQDFSVNNAMLNTDSVTSIKIDDGTIVNADINASAAIAGSKISPSFGSQSVNVEDGYAYGFGDNSYRIEGKDDGTNARIGFVAAGSEKMRIDSTGRLLIGSTSALSHGGIESHLQVLGTGTDDSSITLSRFSNNVHSPYIAFAKSRNGSVGGNTVVQSGDSIGRMTFFGNDGTDGNTPAAEIDVEVDGTPGSNDMPGRIVFRTTSDGASSVTERMRVDSSGDITVNFDGSSQTGQFKIADGSASSPGLTFWADGSNDTGIFRSGANTLNFSTGGSERMRIDSSGNLIIGATSYQNGGFGGSSHGINIAGSQPQILLHETDTDKDGYFGLAASILRIQTADSIPVTIWTNDTKRINVHETTGDTTIETGNLVIGTAGKGIDFSADGNASGMTSELLDDYEEGTFTPVLNNAGSFSVNNHTGTYTKVGRLVHYIVQISGTCTGTGSGTFTVSGLPFSANNATGGHGQAGCMGALFRWNIPDTAYQIGIRVSDSNSFIQFFANFDNANDAQLTSPFDAGTIFGSLAGSYFTS